MSGKNLFIYKTTICQIRPYWVGTGEAPTSGPMPNMPIFRSGSKCAQYKRLQSCADDKARDEGIRIRSRRWDQMFMIVRDAYNDNWIRAADEMKCWKRSTKRRHQYRVRDLK